MPTDTATVCVVAVVYIRTIRLISIATGADPGFFEGGVSVETLVTYYIIYCNYSHYYFLMKKWIVTY